MGTTSSDPFHNWFLQQDGMHTIWDEKLVASYIGRHAAIIRPDMVS
jgi:hypothetical protein